MILGSNSNGLCVMKRDAFEPDPGVKTGTSAPGAVSTFPLSIGPSSTVGGVAVASASKIGLKPQLSVIELKFNFKEASKNDNQRSNHGK